MADDTRINIDVVSANNQASSEITKITKDIVEMDKALTKTNIDMKSAFNMDGFIKTKEIVSQLSNGISQTTTVFERMRNGVKQSLTLMDGDIKKNTQSVVANVAKMQEQLKSTKMDVALSNVNTPEFKEEQKKEIQYQAQKKAIRDEIKTSLGLTKPKQETEKLQFGDTGYKEQRKAELSLQNQKKLLDENLKKQLGIKNAAQGFASNLAKAVLSFAAIRKAVGFATSALKKSADWTENLNLFEVTFGKASADTMDFALNIQKAYGIAANEIIRYTGLFKQMSEAIGIAENTSTEMSKTLTTLGYDIASLYNISTKSAMEKLQAGIAGQTKPLRGLGMDITAQSLDKYLGDMGLDYTSKMLNQADKMLLRTIVIVDQAKNTYGDMAKTINTFSNQVKVFNGSLENFKLAVGDLIIKPATTAITYVNGFIIAMTNIIRAFVGQSQTSGLNDMVESIGKVDEATQDLEKTMGLLSFDKFESLSKGEGGASGINGMLTDEFAKKQAEYMEKFNEQMDTIKNKANEVAKAIQKWIFPNGLNTESGNFFDIISQINPVVVAIVGTLALLTGIGIVSGIIKLGKTIGSALISPIGVVLGGIMLLLYNIGNLIHGWDDMSGWERAVGIIGAVAGAIMLVVGAIAAFHGAWSLGIAVAAIAAGLVAVGATIASFTMSNKRQAEEMSKMSIPKYAQGGYPDKGQMFIANEAGAELVGNIGGNTAVANNDMIVQAIENAAYRGYIRAIQQTQQKSGGNQNIELQLDINGREFARATYSDIRAEGKRRGY